MWAEREDIHLTACASEPLLARALEDEGLQLERFQAIHGRRIDTPSGQTDPPAGALLDLRA
jgi:hypothetical protein